MKKYTKIEDLTFYSELKQFAEIKGRNVIEVIDCLLGAGEIMKLEKYGKVKLFKD